MGQEAVASDQSLLEGWQRSMDGLLIFAAIFSAILTGFLIESYKSMKPDYSAATVALLAELAQTMRANNTSVNDVHYTVPLSSQPTLLSKIVNEMRFTALDLCLMTSVLAALGKYWLNEYLVVEMSDRDRVGGTEDSLHCLARLRQYRYDNLNKWHTIPEILAFLPILLNVALLIFVVGLIVFLWSLDENCAIILVVMTSVTPLIYIGSMTLPIFVTACPYKTPLTHTFSTFRQFRKCALLDMEKKKVARNGRELDKRILDWTARNAAVAKLGTLTDGFGG